MDRGTWVEKKQLQHTHNGNVTPKPKFSKGLVKWEVNRKPVVAEEQVVQADIVHRSDKTNAEHVSQKRKEIHKGSAVFYA